MFEVKLQVKAGDIAGMIAANVEYKINNNERLDHIAKCEKSAVEGIVYDAVKEFFDELNGEVLD